MSDRYAIVDDATGAVTNIVLWDGVTQWSPPQGSHATLLTPALEAAFNAPVVPASVTNYQARAALIAAGLFDTVNNAMLAQPASSDARQAWEYANNFFRNSAFITQLGPTLGLTDAQIDQLFIAASQIQ